MSKKKHKSRSSKLHIFILLNSLCILYTPRINAQNNNIAIALIEIKDRHSYKAIINIPEQDYIYYQYITLLKDTEKKHLHIK